jgi:O-6-methylguanine DNA methyltransferase
VELRSIVNVLTFAQPITVVAAPEGVVSILLGVELPPDRGSVAARTVASTAARQIEQYLAGRRCDFDLPLLLDRLTAFQKTILSTCQNIPYGHTWSYSKLAQEARVGASAARATGGALARNPVPILIPCHRVVRVSGDLGGFGAGLEWKLRLLELEGAPEGAPEGVA